MQLQNLIPIMTSNTTPSGMAFASTTYYTRGEFKAFNKLLSSSAESWSTTGSMVGFIGYTFQTPTKVNRYSIYNQTSFPRRAPRKWRFEGSNDKVDWVILDERDIVQEWQNGIPFTYDFVNETEYTSYRLYIEININGSGYTGIQELEMYYSPPQVRYLLNKDNNYYYYNTTNWTLLGPSLTYSDIMTYGMNSLNSEINSFVAEYGSNFRVIVWSPDTFTKSVIDATPFNQKVYANDDISLVGIESLDSVLLTASGSGKIAISFDQGVTYNAYSNGMWSPITELSQGMGFSDFNLLTSEQLIQLKGDSNTIRFAYYVTEDTLIDRIQVKVSLSGTEKLASTSDYEVSYNQATKTIDILFKKSSSYSVNYVDTP